MRSRTTRQLISALACAAISMVGAGAARASLSYTTTGSTVTQNFDSLPNSPTDVSLGSSPVGWTDDNAAPGAGNFSIQGWYLFHPLGPLAEGGFNGKQRMRIGAG